MPVVSLDDARPAEVAEHRPARRDPWEHLRETSVPPEERARCAPQVRALAEALDGLVEELVALRDAVARLVAAVGGGGAEAEDGGRADGR